MTLTERLNEWREKANADELIPNAQIALLDVVERVLALCDAYDYDSLSGIFRAALTESLGVSDD